MKAGLYRKKPTALFVSQLMKGDIWGSDTGTKFLITKFLITKFLVTKFLIDESPYNKVPKVTKFLKFQRNFVIGNFVIRNFVIRNFVLVPSNWCKTACLTVELESSVYTKFCWCRNCLLKCTSYKDDSHSILFRICLLLELGPVSVKENEEAEAEGEDEEGVPGQEQEEGLQHTQEHRHVDVAFRQLRVHAHLSKINQTA